MFAILIYCRNRMACRQLGQLDTPAEEEGADPDEEGVGSLAHKRSERGIDLAAGAGVENPYLQSHGEGSRFHVSQGGRRSAGIGGIEEHSHASRSGHQRTQEFQPLCHQLGIEKIDPRQVAARPGEARDKTKRDRVFGYEEDDRDRRDRRFGSISSAPVRVSAYMRGHVLDRPYTISRS
jgi:hypothetical protein